MPNALMVPCPQFTKTGETRAFETEDWIYSRTVSARERMLLPEHIGETYEPCAGDVPVHPDGTFGRCSECWGGDWTAAELAILRKAVAG